MKKALQIFQALMTWLLLAAAAAMMLFTVLTAGSLDGNGRSFLGHRAYIVLTDSMATTGGDASRGYFRSGDLAVIKKVSPESLKPGDIISYISTDPDNFGQTVTHMIRRSVTTQDGQPAFITYGTDTGQDDAYAVTYGHIQGKFVGSIAGAGRFFQFLKTAPGYFLCILLPFLLLIAIQGIQLLRQLHIYRQAQLEHWKAEQRAALEEQMLQKLRQMQPFSNDPDASGA